MKTAKLLILESSYSFMSKETLGNIINELMAKIENLSLSDRFSKAQAKNYCDRLEAIRTILIKRRESQ